jgi:hypothetical protein
MRSSYKKEATFPPAEISTYNSEQANRIEEMSELMRGNEAFLAPAKMWLPAATIASCSFNESGILNRGHVFIVVLSSYLTQQFFLEFFYL